VSKELLLPEPHKKATFSSLYSKVTLYEAALYTYTKPLFSWRKALVTSHDERTLYEFARYTRQNMEKLHNLLVKNEFHFREGIELNRNFNGKHRTIYIFPWEERIVDLMLYRMLNRRFHNFFSNHCYAYRYRGYGVDSCQHRVRKQLKQTPQPIFFIKRDIENYFPSIDQNILLSFLSEWIASDDYIFTLIEERVKFKYRTQNGEKTATRGVPFGNAIACFFANIYLTPLDYEIDQLQNLAYYRYADDFLAFSHNREIVLEASERLDSALSALKLRSKPSHHKNFMFTPETDQDKYFENASKFRHLGLEFRSDGSVGLSRDKVRKIRNLFRYAFRRQQRKLRTLQAPEHRAQFLVDIAKNVIEQGFRSVALIDYYLKHVDDEEQLRLLDRWIAEEILAQTFRNGHRKGNFRKISFQRLREMGLPSLRHRRRLLEHGHLESSFFVFRTKRLIGQGGEAAARSLDLSSKSKSSGKTNLVRKGAAC
jgi:hypothetical protein